MNEERKEEIRREDRKWSGKFVLILIAALLVGGLCGIGLNCLGELDDEVLAYLSGWVAPIAANVVQWLAFFVTLIVSLVCCRRGRVLLSSAGEDEDELRKQADRQLSYTMTATALQMVVTFTCFGITSTGLNAAQSGRMGFDVCIVVTSSALVGLVASMAAVMAIQRRVVNLIKEQNPEKQGSVFQINFNKTWISSCDEAERAQMYRAGFRAYRVGFYTCLGAWLVATFGAMIGWLTWGSVLLVGIIWGALQMTYCVSCQKDVHSTVAL